MASRDDRDLQHELMAGCEAGPGAAAAEPRSSSPGHQSEGSVHAPTPAVPTRPAYADALVEAVMAQDVLSVLLALRVLCAKGLLYSRKTGVDAKHSTLGISALELQMRQADSPQGQAILQLLFLNLDGCLKWKTFEGPLYHHGPLKKWARAALQAFKRDKGRNSTLGRSLLRTADDNALGCLLRANGLERRTARMPDPLREHRSGLDRSSPAQPQSVRVETVRCGDRIPIKKEEIEEGELPTEPTCVRTLHPLGAVHRQRGMDHCTWPLDLGPVGHYVRFDPYPTPSLSPPPGFPPERVEGQDKRPQDTPGKTQSYGPEVAPQRSAVNHPSPPEESLLQPFRPPSDHRQEADSRRTKSPPPSEPPLFSLPSITSRKRSASPSPVTWASPLPPPPVEKRSRLIHPSRKHVRWAAHEFVVVGTGAGHVSAEDLYYEIEGSRSHLVALNSVVAGTGAAWAKTAVPPSQRAPEVLNAERLPDHHVESISLAVKAPATSSAVPSSWTAWYDDCLDPV